MQHVPQPIRPGAGMEVEHVRLAPIRQAITAGTYEINPEAQAQVQDGIANPDLSDRAALDILNHPDNKGFRNSYTSLLVDEVWPAYRELVAGDEPGIYEGTFEGDVSKLRRRTPDEIASFTGRVMASALARSNQDVSVHLVSEQLRDGRVPRLTSSAEADETYAKAFREQADLLISKVGAFFDVVPPQVTSDIKAVVSGLLILRTHVLGTPNLIDGVADRQGIVLTPDQHRNSVETSIRRMSDYYLPTGILAISVNDRLIDPETRELDPKKCTSNGNPDNFLVFPKPEIVQGVHDSLEGVELPAQTNCPAFHSRVEGLDHGATVLPLPRALLEVTLAQLDRWYYPVRRAEAARAVSLPAGVAEGGSASEVGMAMFPDGIFVPRSETVVAAAAEMPESAGADHRLSAREERAVELMTSNTGMLSFGVFMENASRAIIGETLGAGHQPSPAHVTAKHFYRRALVDADGFFDQRRDAFSGADKQSFAERMFAVQLARTGDLSFTVGETVTTVAKLASNPGLYPAAARKLLQNDGIAFINEGVLGMSRLDTPDLSGADTQRIKEVTNGLHAAILFDLEYGASVESEGYAQARDRYIAAALVFQYRDDALDVVADTSEGSANLLTAFAQDSGEREALQVAHAELSESRPVQSDRIVSPPGLKAYLSKLQQTAPKAYARMVSRQRELLAIAKLPPEVEEVIALPEISS